MAPYDPITRPSAGSPLVSVIIATYNRADFLKKALTSVLGQSYSNLEIIVVDDGSNDHTDTVVAGFDSSRIIYLRQENRGCSAARNRGLATSRGEYVAFLDSDDRFHPEKLAKQLAALEAHPECGMCYTSAIVEDGQGQEIIRPGDQAGSDPYYRAVESGWLYDRIAFYLPVTVLLPTVMVRSSILRKVGGFDETLYRFEDTDLWRRISRITPLLALDAPMTIVVTHDGNRLRDAVWEFRAVDRYVAKVFSEENSSDPMLLKRGGASLFLHYGLAVYAAGDFDSAMNFFIKAFQHDPDQPSDYFLAHRLFNWRRALIFMWRSLPVHPIAAMHYFTRYLIAAIISGIRSAFPQHN